MRSLRNIARFPTHCVFEISRTPSRRSAGIQVDLGKRFPIPTIIVAEFVEFMYDLNLFFFSQIAIWH